MRIKIARNNRWCSREQHSVGQFLQPHIDPVMDSRMRFSRVSARVFAMHRSRAVTPIMHDVLWLLYGLLIKPAVLRVNPQPVAPN